MITHAILRKGREDEPAILMVDIVEGVPPITKRVLLSVSFREFTMWGRAVNTQRQKMEDSCEI